MAAFSLDLHLEQGATFTKTVTWVTGTAPGTPVNLTGASAILQVRYRTTSSATLLDLTSVPANGIVIDGPAGTLTISLTAAQTAALTWTAAVYDCLITMPDGSVKRLFEGRISVKARVTRGP